ncbi:ester cyclase [Pseudonocardia sp. ICBG162]|uniref:ester cyclase n=1 Tax=Pseudonocardia sp. ICBG162 TaxID=2846761 RepID=UPI001CF6FCF2|nr:ester cyclase [Pseudonocardia sp. ICBG162]
MTDLNPRPEMPGREADHRHGTEIAQAQSILDVMRDGDEATFAGIVHPRGTNLEAALEPLACRVPGPAGFHATAMLLRHAFSGLDWSTHAAVARDDTLVAHATMSGRHTGVLYDYDRAGQVVGAFPPTGRTFSTTQTHWFRFLDDLIIEHWANRDDLRTATQLGWLPPRPLYLARMLLVTRRAQRAQRCGEEPVLHSTPAR